VQNRLSAGGRLDLPLAGEWLTRAAALRVARRTATAAQRALLSDVMSIFLATRLAFLLLTYFGRALVHDPALVGKDNMGLGTGYLLDAWLYRDSQWYLTIVQDGYHYFGPGHRSAVAFFPVYPLLVKALHGLTAIDLDLCTMIVSNVAFLGAMIFLYKLCAREYGVATARRATFYMAIFPTAFFTFAPYSESLFLLCSIASFYYMRGERWWLAGIFGGLAAATRVLGVLLLLAFAWEYLHSRHFQLRRIRLDALAGALIPAGLGAYMLYLYGLTGDPMAFVKSAAGWNRDATWPWQVLTTSLEDVPKTAQYGQYLQAHALIENGLVIACLLLLLAGIRRIPFSFILYGLACIAVLLSAPVASSTVPVTSMSRYVLVLAPIYIVLARMGRYPIFDRLYTLLSASGLAIFTTLFLNHMWGA
jgi:Gpi18-like mannosyltransferase